MFHETVADHLSAPKILGGTMRITISLICVLLTTQLIGQSAFSAIMQKTDSELIYLYSVPFEEVQKQNEQYASEGFELVDLEYADSKFWAIWRNTGESTILGQVDSWESFQELKKREDQRWSIIG